MAVVQAMHGQLTHRHRRQASSHIYFVVYPTDKPKQLVLCGERACRNAAGKKKAAPCQGDGQKIVEAFDTNAQ